MMKARDIFLACLAVAGVASARTVALWPLEATESGAFDGRCVIDSRNDLSVRNFTLVDSDLGWDLPPCPDAAPHAWNPVNAKAVRQVVNGKDGNGFLDNNETGIYVARDRDFTLEGWIKILDLPARNQWACLAGGFNDNSSKNRWTLSLRRRPDENYACTWIIWAQGGSDKVAYAYPSEEASFDITNTWMHVALTHKAYVSGQDTWTVFINGVQVGSSVRQPGSVPTSYETPRFDLGARRTASNPISAVFDYWRISDKVLAPSEFLCAGGTGTTIAPSRTVAYWPLEATADGGVDGRDAVGDAPLTSGFQDTTARYNRMSPSDACAFTGNPPNPTVTLPDGNAGSLQGVRTSGCLRQDALGALLNMSADFTVEGWFAPRLCERTNKSANDYAAYLFGTRPDQNQGWVLAYRPKSATDILFDIYSIDSSGVFRNNVKLSGSYPVAQWYETWHHLALVYDANGGANGYGLWSFFIDGVLVGETGNPRAVVPVTQSRVFILGGRAEVAEQSFQGGIDCVRVSQAALRPTQFLCAKEGAEAATNVLALWPLNVEGGAYLDLRDVSGNNRHLAGRPGEWYRQKATGDLATPGPVIRNPDRSPNFRGSRTKTHGSVRFRDPDAAQDMDRAYLATGNTAVTWALRGGHDSTFEFYYMRRPHAKSINSDSQEVFLTLGDGQSGVSVRFFRKPDGIYIWENRNGTVNDTKFPGTADADLAVDTWYHVALVHAIEMQDGVKKTVWRLYVDGALKGTVSANSNDSELVNPTVHIGGRYYRDRNSVLGNLSSMRVSSAALEPGEFLCAEPSGPLPSDEPASLAYWPIDTGADGLANRLGAEGALLTKGTVASQDDKAFGKIPNADALAEVTGAARRNTGSYALSNGALVAPGLGHRLSFTSAFTVEGWVKWATTGSGTEDLISVGEVDSGRGLRVSLDRTGTKPALRVFARAIWPSTPIVDAAFDADLTDLLGEWVHIALTYDPGEGTGTWTLYADGEKLGNPVANFWRANGTDYFRDGDFRIGSATAAVDMWRVSSGVWDAKSFLWARPKGIVIFVR